MLERGAASWVHYKLDRGIDHILIDEAQDTSPQQWQIVRALTDEFFAGAGARDAQAHDLCGRRREAVDLLVSGRGPARIRRQCGAFRSAEPRGGGRIPPRAVRPFVPLRRECARRRRHRVRRQSESTKASRPTSAAFRRTSRCRSARPGWSRSGRPVKPAERHEIEAWDAPFDDDERDEAAGSGLPTRSRNTSRCACAEGARAGDVLVLVRQRGPLFEAIIRALKEHDVAVAGADRLVLTEHIAVMDLMALADALLLPGDDLALATVLKSPLFGLDDDDLFAIAWGRKGSLRAALRANAQTQPRFAEASEALDRFAGWARRETPFSFFARVLGPERGRRKFLARLGPEANDALDEFLNVALDYESRETPSLHGFLAWLRSAQTDVKRDMEITRDEVRVMTVHGAKGLEAPIVILADTTTPPAGPPQRQPRLLALAGDGAADASGQFVWAAAKATDVAVVSGAREGVRREAEHEYRRLLYVAMTRASDRLIVCGYDGGNRAPARLLVRSRACRAAPLAVEEAADDGDGTIWRYRKTSVGDRRGGRSLYLHPGGAGGGTPPLARTGRATRGFRTVRSCHLRLPTTRARWCAPRPLSGVERRKALARGELDAPAAPVVARHSGGGARERRRDGISHAMPPTFRARKG